MKRSCGFEPEETVRFPCPVCGEAHPEHLICNRMGRVLGCSECLTEELPERYYETAYPISAFLRQ